MSGAMPVHSHGAASGAPTILPGLGEVADLANAGIYAAEGNKTDAALSVGSAVPFAGCETPARAGQLRPEARPFGSG